LTVAKHEFAPGDAFRNIDQALWLLTAWRSEEADTRDQNEWLRAELQKLIPSNDLEDLGAMLGAMISAFLQLSSAFLDGWANAADGDASDLLAVARRINEMNLRDSGNSG
jgi:hypothetical protein